MRLFTGVIRPNQPIKWRLRLNSAHLTQLPPRSDHAALYVGVLCMHMSCFDAGRQEEVFYGFEATSHSKGCSES